MEEGWVPWNSWLIPFQEHRAGKRLNTAHLSQISGLVPGGELSPDFSFTVHSAPLKAPCGFCRSQGWVRGDFSYLWLLWFRKKKKMASAISFIKNLGLTRSFCFCLLSGGRTNPFQVQLFVLAFLFEYLWPPTVLPSQSVQQLEERMSSWIAADRMNVTVKFLTGGRMELLLQISAFTTLWK